MSSQLTQGQGMLVMNDVIQDNPSHTQYGHDQVDAVAI